MLSDTSVVSDKLDTYLSDRRQKDYNISKTSLDTEDVSFHSSICITWMITNTVTTADHV